MWIPKFLKRKWRLTPYQFARLSRKFLCEPLEGNLKLLKGVPPEKEKA